MIFCSPGASLRACESRGARGRGPGASRQPLPHRRTLCLLLVAQLLAGPAPAEANGQCRPLLVKLDRTSDKEVLLFYDELKIDYWLSCFWPEHCQSLKKKYGLKNATVGKRRPEKDIKNEVLLKSEYSIMQRGTELLRRQIAHRNGLEKSKTKISEAIDSAERRLSKLEQEREKFRGAVDRQVKNWKHIMGKLRDVQRQQMNTCKNLGGRINQYRVSLDRVYGRLTSLMKDVGALSTLSPRKSYFFNVGSVSVSKIHRAPGMYLPTNSSVRAGLFGQMAKNHNYIDNKINIFAKLMKDLERDQPTRIKQLGREIPAAKAELAESRTSLTKLDRNILKASARVNATKSSLFSSASRGPTAVYGLSSMFKDVGEFSLPVVCAKVFRQNALELLSASRRQKLAKTIKGNREGKQSGWTKNGVGAKRRRTGGAVSALENGWNFITFTFPGCTYCKDTIEDFKRLHKVYPSPLTVVYRIDDELTDDLFLQTVEEEITGYEVLPSSTVLKVHHKGPKLKGTYWGKLWKNGNAPRSILIHKKGKHISCFYNEHFSAIRGFAEIILDYLENCQLCSSAKKRCAPRVPASRWGG